MTGVILTCRIVTSTVAVLYPYPESLHLKVPLGHAGDSAVLHHVLPDCTTVVAHVLSLLSNCMRYRRHCRHGSIVPYVLHVTDESICFLKETPRWASVYASSHHLLRAVQRTFSVIFIHRMVHQVLPGRSGKAPLSSTLRTRLVSSPKSPCSSRPRISPS